jgi:NAD(P)-dependent dehydrogenase (short-subunit alcohol dehydrogenase family)
VGKLEGKIALITGGSRGIGLATAKRFVDEGVHVFITGRREAELASAVKDIGKNVKALKGDVSKLDELDRIFTQIKEDSGKLDIVFVTDLLIQRQKRRLIRHQYVNARYETGEPGSSHSASFDHRRLPETLRTAMAMAFFCPTKTTSCLPRVTPV